MNTLTVEMAAPLPQSACVLSVLASGAPAWVDTPWGAEWGQTLHSLDCDPMVPLVTCWSVTGNGQS